MQNAAKADSHRVIEIARQAAQTAEDGRLIALQRQQQDNLQAAQADAAQARQEASSAQLTAAQIKEQADAQIRHGPRQEADAAVQRANALAQQAESDRAALAQAQSEAAAARAREQQVEIAAVQPRPNPAHDADRMSALRVRLLEDLNGVLPRRPDTPRGLVVTISEADFSGDSVRGAAAEKIARISAIVSGHCRGAAA